MVAGLAALPLAAAAPVGLHARAPLFRTRSSQFVELQPARRLTDLLLERPEGGRIDARAWTGKALLLNVWATWCPPCRHELPILDRLASMSGSEPFSVVALSIDREPGRISPFVHALGMRHLTIAADPQGRVVAPFGQESPAPFATYGMPLSFVVDRQSRIAGYVTGIADWTQPDGLALLRHYGRD